jgi:hypothetical protein
MGSLALGEVRQVRLLCEPYVRQVDVLVPNTNSTDCVPLTKEGLEGEYAPLVCPNPAVTEVDTSDANWLVRYRQAMAHYRCRAIRGPGATVTFESLSPQPVPAHESNPMCPCDMFPPKNVSLNRGTLVRRLF